MKIIAFIIMFTLRQRLYLQQMLLSTSLCKTMKQI